MDDGKSQVALVVSRVPCVPASAEGCENCAAKVRQGCNITTQQSVSSWELSVRTDGLRETVLWPALLRPESDGELRRSGPIIGTR